MAMSGLLQSASICCHKLIRPTIITQCCSLYWNRYCIMHRLQNVAEQIPIGGSRGFQRDGAEGEGEEQSSQSIYRDRRKSIVN